MFAQFLVRLGLSLVFGYMGVDKFLRPDVWLIQMPPVLQDVGINVIFALGVVEVIIALMLLTKRFYVLGALGSAAILAGAIMTMGVNDIAARDIGLLFSSLALLLPWEHHMTPKSIMKGYMGLLKGKSHGGH